MSKLTLPLAAAIAAASALTLSAPTLAEGSIDRRTPAERTAQPATQRPTDPFVQLINRVKNKPPTPPTRIVNQQGDTTYVTIIDPDNAGQCIFEVYVTVHLNQYVSFQRLVARTTAPCGPTHGDEEDTDDGDTGSHSSP